MTQIKVADDAAAGTPTSSMRSIDPQRPSRVCARTTARKDPSAGLRRAYQKLHKEATCNARKHRLAELWWQRLHYLLGVPGSILATIAGATVLGTDHHPLVPAVLALASGSLTATTAFLKSDHRREWNARMYARWDEFDAQVLMAILDLDHAPAGGSKAHSEEFARLAHRKAQLLASGVEDEPGRRTRQNTQA